MKKSIATQDQMFTLTKTTIKELKSRGALASVVGGTPVTSGSKMCSIRTIC